MTEAIKAKVITGADQVKGRLYESGGIIADPYPGPYLVKPKDTAQTLPIQNKTATEDIVVEAVALQAKTVQPNERGQSVLPDAPNVGLSSVSVGEIPSTYVGSNVPRRTQNDVYSVGPVVTVPRGYYDQYVVHEVDEGSLPAPSISVDSTGLVTASVTQDQLHAGYIGNGKTASATQQLSTEAGKTVTPTESEQTAVAAETFTTGDIKVAGDVNFDAANIRYGTSIFGKAGTFTRIAGTDAAGAGDILDGMKAYVNGNLYIGTMPKKAAQIYTPVKGSTQIITAGQYLEGDQTVGAIPDAYYDMSNPMSWLGKDVELLNDKLYYREFTLDQTNFHTWTPSTSASVAVPSVSAGTFTASSMDTYEYYIVWECGLDPVYSSSAVNKAKELSVRAFLVTSISRAPTTLSNLKTAAFANNTSQHVSASTYLFYYGTTTDSKAWIYNPTWTAAGTITAYGFNFIATAASFSSNTDISPTVTINTPSMSVRCNTTYLSTTNAGLIDQEHSHGFIRGRLYRVLKSGIQRGIVENLLPLINGDVEFSSLSPLKLSAPSPGWNGTLEYSYGGSTWATWDGSELENNIIRLRGTGNTTITGGGSTHRWRVTGTDVRVAGNIESLLDFGTVTDYGHPTMAAGAFLGLFSRGESHILDASMLRFPDTVVGDCYREMFEACSTLVYAPSLPATIMQPDCYREMFRGCDNLASAPALPAQALASGCYLGMFKNCLALTAVPSLKAPVLANNCYREMFMGCVDHLKISTTQDTGYDYTFTVPTGVTGTDATDALTDMFLDPYGGIGSPVGTPTINATYYATFQTV